MPIMYSKLTLKFLIIIFAVISLPLSISASSHIATENVSVSARVVGVTTNPTDDCASCTSGSYTGVIFSGWAYPGAVVHIWKNGIPKTTTVADNTGRFTVTITELYSPSALYTLYAIDKAGSRSLLINYPIVVKTGYLTQVSGIRFAPTINTDKTEVKKGDYLTVSGYSLPNMPIDLVIKGKQGALFYLTSNPDGTYKITIPLLNLSKGVYDLYINYQNDKRISKVIQFTIGDINIQSTELTTNIPGDCNADQVINIVDFSIAAFWYSKPNPPKCIDTNKDNTINLVDFSILAFYWTG